MHNNRRKASVSFRIIIWPLLLVLALIVAFALAEKKKADIIMEAGGGVVAENTITQLVRMIYDDRKPNYTKVNIDENNTLTKTFSWNSIGGKEKLDITVNVNADLYHYMHSLPRYYSTHDYAKYVVDEKEQEFLDDLAAELRRMGEEHGYSEQKILEETVNFVQALPYFDDIDYSANLTEWPKYPIETIYEQGGDCEDLCILLVGLMKSLGYDSVFLVMEEHIAVGVPFCFKKNAHPIDYEGNSYYYVETTMRGWEIGTIPQGYGFDVDVVKGWA